MVGVTEGMGIRIAVLVAVGVGEVGAVSEAVGIEVVSFDGVAITDRLGVSVGVRLKVGFRVRVSVGNAGVAGAAQAAIASTMRQRTTIKANLRGLNIAWTRIEFCCSASIAQCAAMSKIVLPFDRRVELQ